MTRECANTWRGLRRLDPPGQPAVRGRQHRHSTRAGRWALRIGGSPSHSASSAPEVPNALIEKAIKWCSWLPEVLGEWGGLGILAVPITSSCFRASSFVGRVACADPGRTVCHWLATRAQRACRHSSCEGHEPSSTSSSSRCLRRRVSMRQYRSMQLTLQRAWPLFLPLLIPMAQATETLTVMTESSCLRATRACLALSRPQVAQTIRPCSSASATSIASHSIPKLTTCLKPGMRA